MISIYRDQYNADFSEEKYQNFLHDLNAEAGYHIDFRIAETPLFVPKEFSEKLFRASDEILKQLTSEEYFHQSASAIPSQLNVPHESKKPTTIALDFAVCKNESGELLPQLIELQAFPSLFGYQHWLAKKYREHFTIPDTVDHLFSGLNQDSYITMLREWIVANENPENVVLLEIEPEKQKTRVDFELTKKYLGINYLCISKVIREGRKLFYEKDGRKIPITRIYNRVIFDELVKRKDLQCQFHLTEDVDVQWVSHPNWFFRISKFSLPFLDSRYVPKTNFLNELKEIPGDLENYVLKPLFSFAGAGVFFDVTKDIVDSIKDRSNYILQRKVNYEPVLRAPDGTVKTEIRILFLWLDEFEKPKPVISVVRLSRGKMIGVDFNKNKTWVGGSVGFFETN
ncbi:MAG TPA: hypothetical protein VE978_07925 [Chitinophagales bacterium]|nr:hypothetical protein [Chitinophagales bacterium]